jgi:pimeloyl-ACP methyl ester carboxylesterase
VKETALTFGNNQSLVGILTEPAAASQPHLLPGVLLLNAGVVHRVGPNRIYVKIARHLATLGFTVLRFDFSGIGDSKVRRDHLPFVASSVMEARAAMDWLGRTRGLERFILTGICSGAAVSFATACQDPRSAGLLLINPDASHLHQAGDEPHTYLRRRATARHYWRIALFSSFRGQNLMRTLLGKVDYFKVLRGMTGFIWGNPFTRCAQVSSTLDGFEVQLIELQKRGVHPFYVFAEGDEGLDYVKTVCGSRLKKWCGDQRLMTMEIIAGANHTFTMLWSQQALLAKVADWAGSCAEVGQL